jgi:hypothetical protein
VNTEFRDWLLIVGLVVGAGLAVLVLMDSRRHEADVDAVELPREAAWLSAVLADDGYDVSPETAERLLLLHRVYLEAPPPDPVDARAAPRLETAPDWGPVQSSPTSTGAASMVPPDAPTSDTPNVAPGDTPDTAGAGPTQ